MCTVPLKPMGRDDAEKKLLLPQGLIRENIGSNMGLMRVLRQFYEERQLHVPGMSDRYYVLNVDINIYDRILKVRIVVLYLLDRQTNHVH